MNHGTARANRYLQKRGKGKSLFSGKAWGGRDNESHKSPRSSPLGSVYLSGCLEETLPGRRGGAGPAREGVSKAAWDLQVARCVHVFDLRFDMRREREHWAAGGTEEAAATYLLTMFLLCVLFPTG